MDNEYNFFAYVARMSLITRWSLMRNARNENDAEHSLVTASVAHALGVISNCIFGSDVSPDRLAVLAIYHDMHEVLTGDMPTPIKHNNPSIKAAYKAVEGQANEKLLTTIPEELRDDYNGILNYDPDSKEGRLVKAADTISAYIKCVEETSMGNADFENALKSTYQRLIRMSIPEVEWFMDKFGSSFGKTIDALD